MRTNQWRGGLLIGILLLAIFWLVSLIIGLAGKAQLAVSQAKDVETQYRELESRKAALNADLTKLATPLGEDEAIRTSFGVARPGEEVIVVVPPTNAGSTTPLSWWQKILQWF